MTNKLSITLILIVGIILATLFLLTPSASAIPTGYEFGELNCGLEAGMAIPSITVKTSISGTGDFLARMTNVKYDTTDLQATDIGYTSTDLTNKRFILGYTLDQYYTDGTPSITASHYLTTSGSSISKEEAGMAYTAISENASNAVTPTSVKLASKYTSMLSNGGTYAAETNLQSSLATDNQPHSLTMTGDTEGYNGEQTAPQGATFWDWSASYEHRLSNTISAPNISGNETMSTHGTGIIGGDHAASYSYNSNVASRVKAIVFEDPEADTEITIPSVDESSTSPVGINPPSMPTNEPTINATENTTANTTVNATEELDLAGYNMANYNTANLHSS